MSTNRRIAVLIHSFTMMTITAMAIRRIWGLSILLWLSCLRNGKAFPSVLSHRGRGARSLSILKISGGLVSPDFLNHDETSYRYLLAKARECAYSDTSTAAEARAFLTRILEMESGCVSGLLAGHDLCENVDEVADVVTHLRRRVEEGPGSLRYVFRCPLVFIDWRWKASTTRTNHPTLQAVLP
jgi:hypothetical protein